MIPALIAGGIGLLGSSMAADSNARAAQISADAQIRAAQIAAEEARFRPVGMTTRFGSSNFQFNKKGRLQGAGYNVSPELQAYQDRLQGLANQGLFQAEAAPGMYQPLAGAATGLFDLGQQYLAQSPEQVAAQYMARQQDLLAPSRERQYAKLQNNLFNTGRGGLAVGSTGLRPGGGAGLGASNPELEAYYNALAQQDAQLASQAQSEGQKQLAFGTTLFGTGSDLLNQYQQGQIGALSPFSNYLSGIGTIESLGQQPLSLGADLGGGNTASANALLQGGIGAARTMQGPNSFNPTASFLQGLGQNPQFGQGVSNAFNRIFGYPGSQTTTDFIP
jgi:hypothetical protein